MVEAVLRWLVKRLLWGIKGEESEDLLADGQLKKQDSVGDAQDLKDARDPFVSQQYSMKKNFLAQNRIQNVVVTLFLKNYEKKIK